MELIAGELIEKMPQNRPHSTCLVKCRKVLEAGFGLGYHVSEQSPLAINE
jgi:hypothetical protein